MGYLQADDEENIHTRDEQRHNNVLIYSLTYGMPQWRINGIQKKKIIIITNWRIQVKVASFYTKLLELGQRANSN